MNIIYFPSLKKINQAFLFTTVWVRGHFSTNYGPTDWRLYVPLDFGVLIYIGMISCGHRV